jgi:protein-L-isoaspartate(D-aspartate) O-methyltransferase
MSDEALRRLNMVESQLRTNKVTDPRILEAMAEVPREAFVPERLRGIAYVDEDIQLGDGRFLMEPMVFARLVQAAGILASDVVLEIGAGCGYGTAVLARLASTVVALESIPGMIATASNVLNAQGVDNAIVVEGDLVAGHPAQAPYDAIVFSGAIAQPPTAILPQIAEGGRMVAVVREESGQGRAMLWTRRAGVIGVRALFDANTPLLPEFAPVRGFAFQ